MRLVLGLVALSLAVLGFALITRAEDDATPGTSKTPAAHVAAVVQQDGTALVRPRGHRRWSPLRGGDVVFPGDVVRLLPRGANATRLALTDGGSLTLGPGTMIQLEPEGRVRHLAGDLEVEAKGATRWWRADGTERKELDEAPRWLRTWRDSVGEMWSGGLLAKIDGRNVPLAVGFHKVTAEIRDQIARTTVEQSFRNRTDRRLEGVFYFPLPADASISGFGMWIGDELVEADVVEKSRAREIYEDIMRRKKDPGLLEWQGGNLFKARVFPIEPNSEKRIRIRYTQVLRREGRTFRYRYALRSDMLTQQPLRRLDVEVNVLSSEPLEDVRCVSHACRETKTGNVARLEHVADEVVPERDLEVLVTVAAPEPVHAITHRRGEDGYFLLMLQPSSPQAQGWERVLTPEGDPLEVILLADTSGSMERSARAVQMDFVEALLSQLGPEDRFRLIAGDQQIAHAFPEAVPAAPANIEVATAFLRARRSLGWTDLEALLGAAKVAASEGALVVYVGDGIPTTGDAEPAAAADRLRRLGEGSGLHVHAVATSSTYEQPVLDALASIGGGSVRRADTDPAEAARALLAEAARPALCDVRVSIEGLETAQVYPKRLPNVPVGTQQVLLGLVKPSDEAREGTVVVRGRLGDADIVVRKAITLPAEDGGNAFLPRLWARRHLDHLLEQGRSPQVQEQIVGFSRKYGIMTPYTSFLVLESDADREHYGVDRMVHMRDGEAFFTQAKDEAAKEAERQATRDARLWREGLRRGMLRQIAGLGRDLVPGHVLRQVAWGWLDVRDTWTLGSSQFDLDLGLDLMVCGRVDDESMRPLFGAEACDPCAPLAQGISPTFMYSEEVEGELGDDTPPPPGLREPSSRVVPGRAEYVKAPDGSLVLVQPSSATRVLDFIPPTITITAPRGRFAKARRANQEATVFFASDGDFELELFESEEAWSYEEPGLDFFLGLAAHPDGIGFPDLPACPRERAENKEPDGPAEAVAALRSLDRLARIRALEGGLRIELVAGDVHEARGTRLDAERMLGLVDAKRWYVRREGADTSPEARWSDGAFRRAVDLGRLLGRERAAQPLDHDAGAMWLGASDLVGAFRGRPLRVEAHEGDLLRLVVEGRTLDEASRHLVIDTAKDLLVEERVVRYGRVLSRVLYRDPVEVLGLWWPRQIDVYGERGVLTRRTDLGVEALDADAFQEAFAAHARRDERVLWIPAQDLQEAEWKRRLGADEGGLHAYLLACVHHAARNQRDEALEAWANVRALAAERLTEPLSLDLIEARLLRHLREGEPLKALLRELSENDRVFGEMSGAWRAEELDRIAEDVLGPGERLGLLRVPPHADEAWHVRHVLRKAQLLAQTGEHDLARRYRRSGLSLHPDSLSLLRAVVDDDARLGHVAEATARLNEALSREKTWSRSERSSLYRTLVDMLWSTRDMERLQRASGAWVNDVPDAAGAWRRLLSLAYMQGSLEDADRLIQHELARRAPYPLSVEAATLSASIGLALGDGWAFYAGRVQAPFVEPLSRLARRLVQDGPESAALADRILNDWKFKNTDGYRLAMAGILQDLEARLETLDPPLLLAALRRIEWAEGATGAPNAERYDALVARVRKRWQDAPTLATRTSLGHVLVQMLESRSRQAEILALLRAWRERESGGRRRALTAALFERLVGGDWQAERELEAVEMLLALLEDDEASAPVLRRLAAQASRRLAAWAFEGRRTRHLGEPASWEGKSRAELRAMQQEAIDLARGEVVRVLADANSRSSDVLRPWLEIEHLGYAVERGEDLEGIEAAARTLLEKSDEDVTERLVLVLDHAATGRGAPDGLAERVLTLFHARDADPDDERLDWRMEIFRLLLALDAQGELAAALRAWSTDSEDPDRWRVALALLLSEAGRLEEAERLLGQVATEGDLQPAEWDALAVIDLALGKDAAREGALEGRVQAMSADQLASLVYQHLEELESDDSGVPGDLDPEAVRATKALLQKATQPASHLWAVGSLYEATKDPRLLRAMAEGVPGHTAQSVYSYLNELTEIEIHEEATIDEAAAAARRLADDGAHPVDRRALKLLEAMLHARAALVAETDETHARRAVAALDDARQGPLVEGEAVLIADFLAAMDEIELEAVAEHQRAWLAELNGRASESTAKALAVAQAYASVLRAYDRPGEAVAVLDRALARVRGMDDHPLPAFADSAFDAVIRTLVHLGRFRDAEARLRAEIDREVFRVRRSKRRLALFDLYVQALEAQGRTSLGQGAQLLDGATQEVDRFLDDGAIQDVHAALIALVRMHKSAAKRGAVQDAGARLETFARERLPRVLPRLVPETSDLVRTCADGIHELAGPAAALGYVLDRQDVEPAFFRRVEWDLWSRMHVSIARWRKDAGDIGALTPRLLSRVVSSLEAHLESGQDDGAGLWFARDTFWVEQRLVFVATAQRMVERHPRDESLIVRAARYLRGGLHEKQLAVGVLSQARGRRALRPDGLDLLGRWLVEDERFTEALPVTRDLQQARSRNLHIRLLTARALHGLGRTDDALRQLEATEAQWKAWEVWASGAAEQIGALALKLGRPKAALGWLDDARARRREERTGAAGSDRTLSRICRRLAEVHAELGDTAKAVEAASAAMVAAGGRQEDLASGLTMLQRALEKAKDLDAWAAAWSARAEKEGQDAPVVRKALAAVYTKQGEVGKTIEHLLVARELAPEDADVHRRLVKAYDTLGHGEQAIQALYAWLGMAPRNLEATEDLATRLAKAGRKSDAERARTNLVEPLPHEAIGHRRLAALFGEARRWPEAATQWRQAIRTDPVDPRPWLSLAAVLDRAGDREAAREAAEHVLETSWPERFEDVQEEAATLLEKLRD